MRAFGTTVTVAMSIFAGQATAAVMASSGKNTQSVSSGGSGSGGSRAFGRRIGPAGNGELVEQSTEQQDKEAPSPALASCVTMERGCTACLGELISCPWTVTTTVVVPAAASTEAATFASVEDAKATGQGYRQEDHPEKDAGLGSILGVVGDTPVKDLTPSEVNVLSAIMSQTSKLGKMLATETAEPAAPNDAPSQVEQQNTLQKIRASASAIPSESASTLGTMPAQTSFSEMVPSGCVPSIDGYYRLEVNHLSSTKLEDTGKHVSIKDQAMMDLLGKTGYVSLEREISFAQQLPSGQQPASSWIVCGSDLYVGFRDALSWWRCADGNGIRIFDNQLNDKCVPVLMRLVPNTSDNNEKRDGDNHPEAATPYPPNECDASPADSEARQMAEAALVGRSDMSTKGANNEIVQDIAATTSTLAPTSTTILTPIPTDPFPSSTTVLFSTSTVTPISGGVEKREDGRCGYQHGGKSCWGDPAGECCNGMLGMCGSADSCYPMMCDPSYGHCESPPDGVPIWYNTEREALAVVEETTTVTAAAVTTTVTVYYANASTTTSGEPYIPVDSTTSSCSDNATTTSTISDSFVSINVSTFSATGLTIAPITAGTSASLSFVPTLNSTSPAYTPPSPPPSTAGAGATSIGGFPVAATATVGSGGMTGQIHAGVNGNGMVATIAAGVLSVAVLGMLL